MTIRWAYDDPNPVAIDAIKRADQDIMYALLKAKGISVDGGSAYQYPADYAIPEPKKIMLENGVDVTVDRPDLAYPNTDAQYQSSSLLGQRTRPSEDEDEEEEEDDGDENENDAEGGWEKLIDENTGATYYFNTHTGESSWSAPN